jgi:hypothetical protein
MDFENTKILRFIAPRGSRIILHIHSGLDGQHPRIQCVIVMRMMTDPVVFPKNTVKRIDMHRWLCTAVPLLIGSLAAGDIDAATAAGACAEKRRGRAFANGYASAPAGASPDHAGPAIVRTAYQPDSKGESMRLCVGCHDGTVARLGTEANEYGSERHIACGPAHP